MSTTTTESLAEVMDDMLDDVDTDFIADKRDATVTAIYSIDAKRYIADVYLTSELGETWTVAEVIDNGDDEREHFCLSPEEAAQVIRDLIISAA